MAFAERRKTEGQKEHFWVVAVLRVGHELNFRYNKFEMPFIPFDKNTYKFGCMNVVITAEVKGRNINATSIYIHAYITDMSSDSV